MTDEEFRDSMVVHMERQTSALDNISRVAGVWEETWVAARTVARFFAWVLGLFGIVAAIHSGFEDFARWFKHN